MCAKRYYRLHGAIILKIMYDMDVVDWSDEFINLSGASVTAIGATQVPGKFWVEFLPVLRYIPGWVPGAYFKRYLKRFAPEINKMVDEPFNVVKQNIVRPMPGWIQSLSLIYLTSLHSSRPKVSPSPQSH